MTGRPAAARAADLGYGARAPIACALQLPMPSDFHRAPTERLAAVLAMAALLLLVLQLRLAGAFLAAVGSYAVYRQLLAALRARLTHGARATAAVLTLLAFFGLGLAAVEAVDVLRAPHGGLQGLLQLLAETVGTLRNRLPPWLAQRLPESAQELQQATAAWLGSHTQDLQRWGGDLLRIAAHVVVGFVIGLLAAFRAPGPAPTLRAPVLLQARAHHVLAAFSQVVAAQFRIAVTNTALTAVFILVLLPLASVHLPLARTLVVLTFVAGLVPIVGNLISNTAIVLVALTVSPSTALAALAYLVGIHKLEYFLNAHFVSRSTRVPAPALLAAMLVLEAAYGVPGLLCAPIYTAWACMELQEAALI